MRFRFANLSAACATGLVASLMGLQSLCAAPPDLDPKPRHDRPADEQTQGERSAEDDDEERAELLPVRVDFVNDAADYLWLTQTQPSEPSTSSRAADGAGSTDASARLAMATTRRRGRTYRMPSMFGDFFGGGAVQAIVQGPPIQIPQMVVDGMGGIDLFVVNADDGFGASFDPTVPITVLLGGPSGQQVAVSIGPGVDTNGDQQPDTYPISQPMNLPGTPPAAPGAGTLVYSGGDAMFPGVEPIGNPDGWQLNLAYLFTPNEVRINVPAGAGAVRRIKIAENNSPLPRDRFIFNYNFYNDVFSGIGDVNQYTFGFERTFLDGLGSVELLAPFASTLAADQFVGGAGSRDTEFGDLAMMLKLLLFQNEDIALAGGVGLGIPTGGDANVYGLNNRPIVNLQNGGLHVLPYLGALRTYESGWYWQGFVQLDIDTSGSDVNADVTGVNPRPIGTLQDQTLLFVDFGVGRWLTAPPGDDGTFPAVAATAEIHYSATLDDADVVNGNGIAVTSNVNRYDVVNMTFGASVLLNDAVTIRPAMVVPLNSGDNRQFDFEAMVQMNFWR